jgi:diguanylate cyclase (GGDEF)-like protein
MRFDAALNNMTQGLCMYDAEQRVVVANSRFGEIYGLAPAQTAPGTTARQILEHRMAIGTYDGVPPDEYLKKVFRESSDVQTLPNGRVLSILRQWLPDGSVLTTHEDITDRRQNEAKVAFMAHHDLLTGLANRTYFMEKIEEAGARLRRRGEAFTVFMLDLDRFKDVNDSLGHPAGDALLEETAQRLRASLRETDVLARLGGDEFAILQSGEPDQRAGAIQLAVRIIELIAQPFDLDGRKVSIGTSIGIALAPQDGIDPGELLKKADLALYRTKFEGRNGFNFFHAGMTAEADARHQLESEMREAIERNEFELHYQTVIDVATREPRGAEALVRWRHPAKGLIAPERFIPLAEDTGLIVQLGAWILQKACADAATWPAHVRLAVNLSPVQFRRGDLFDLILCALVDSGLPPERLELEITESVLLENEANYRVLLQQLKNVGISIVLDDFGTGYSSLGYLTTFPVDKIKIDRSFTQGIARRAECAAVVASVLTLARGLDIATTAEGVETEEQFEMLRAAGVTLAQGYLFGRPCPLGELGFANPAVDEPATNAA